MRSQKNQTNCEPENPLKQRIAQLMSEEDLKHPYAWAAKIGLSKGTFSGIWNLGRNALHKSTAEKISVGTGANIQWIQTGIGQPFDQSQSQTQTQATETPSNPPASPEQGKILLDLDTLEMAIHTLESVLEQTRRTMSPSKKTELILAIYQLYASTPHPTQMRPTVETLIRSAA